MQVDVAQKSLDIFRLWCHPQMSQCKVPLLLLPSSKGPSFRGGQISVSMEQHAILYLYSLPLDCPGYLQTAQGQISLPSACSFLAQAAMVP